MLKFATFNAFALGLDTAKAVVYREVVGVVKSVQREQLGGAGSLDVYLPYRQSSESNQYLLIKTELPPQEVQRRVEQTLWSIDSEQSVFDFRTYPDRILDGIWQLRLSQSLLLIFGGVALVLSAIGIYSLMSYVVVMQRRELGVRLALGAQPSILRWFIVKRGGRLALLGIAVGGIVSIAFGFGLKSQISQVQAIDPVALGTAAAIVMLGALAASAIPAWQASRLDPLIALRGD